MSLQKHIIGARHTPTEREIRDEFNIISLKDNPSSFAPVTARVEDVIQHHKRGKYAARDLTIVYGEEHSTLMHVAQPIGGINAMVRAAPKRKIGVYFEEAPNNFLERSWKKYFIWNKKHWLEKEWNKKGGAQSLARLSKGYHYTFAPSTKKYRFNFANKGGENGILRPIFADAAKYFENGKNYIKHNIDSKTDAVINNYSEAPHHSKISATSIAGMRMRNHKLYATYGHGVAMTGKSHIYGDTQDNEPFKDSLEGIDDTHRRTGKVPRMQVIIFPLESGDYIKNYIDHAALDGIKRKNDWCDYAQPNLIIDGIDDWFNYNVAIEIDEEKELLEYVLNQSGEVFIPEYA